MRTRKTHKGNHNQGVSYQVLETRCLLATVVTFNALTGELSIDLTDDNDTAMIDVSGGNVTVNGSQDIDSNLAGVQTTSADAVTNILVNGDETKDGQSVELNGDFSNAAGRSLESIEVDSVNALVINGDYQLSDRLDIRLVGSGGGLTDGSNGRFRVGGETDIQANANQVELNSGLSDFLGPVKASNLGGNNMLFVANDTFVIDEVFASGDFQVFALGDILDTVDATILVEGVGRFNGANVTLGDDAGDDVDLFGFQAISDGDVTLTQSSSVQLNGIQANNLTVNTPDGIFDTRTSVIEVSGTATFNGASRVRIGENGNDTFNAGFVTFNSGGHVHIWEDSATVIAGSNTALSANLFSIGDLTDADEATINVVNLTSFEAENVTIGDTETDQFNSGAIYFFTPGDLRVTEDSGLHLTETKNQAQNMVLTSTETITDATGTRINILGNATFIAASVNVGNEPTDVFNSDTLTFATSSRFQIAEDSDTVFAGVSSAGNVDVTSLGSISNDQDPLVVPASMDVQTLAVFDGLSINLGNRAGDQFDFGGLQFNAPGDVLISEDSDTVLSQTSGANSLTLTSAGSIFDAESTVLSVVDTTTLVGNSILLGDSATDQFTTQLLSLQVTGDAELTEQTGVVLTGTNRATNLSLVTSGNILDTLTADTQVTGNLTLVGDLLNLGSETTDFLTFGSLTIVSAGNSNVTADSDIQLSGESRIGDILLLTTDGDITDIDQARTEITTRAILTGDDVILGDLADDCFDIANGGAANLFVTATGTNDVTVDCPST